MNYRAFETSVFGAICMQPSKQKRESWPGPPKKILRKKSQIHDTCIIIHWFRMFHQWFLNWRYVWTFRFPGARRDGCPQQASSNTGDSPDPVSRINGVHHQYQPTWDFLKPKKWQSRSCLWNSDIRFLPFFLRLVSSDYYGKTWSNATVSPLQCSKPLASLTY